MTRLASSIALVFALLLLAWAPLAVVAESKTPKKKCCRVCKKGKPCGKSCIAKDRKCKKKETCACKGS
ncbi:MAG: hypothetical protein KC609_03405 [Myxococcales bacterium]|nr:hypothetical protein [Myxococcales bacterium]